MRATINFDIDLDRVEETMAALMSQEASTLHITANILDNLGTGPLLQEVTEALDLLRETSAQLQQYQNMLISFEQAKFKTIVPQEVEDVNFNVADNLRAVKEMTENMKQFDDFLGEIETQDIEDSDDSKEG